MQQSAEHATQDNAPRGLTIAEAAAHLGVSVDTIRRRVKRGELQAAQVQTERGPVWRVSIDGLPDAPSVPSTQPPSVHSVPSSNVHSMPGVPSSSVEHAVQERPELLKALEMLEHAQAEVVAKAEAAAMWQARAEFLAGQLERAQLALAAPKEPAASGRPFLADSEGVAVEPTQTPSTPRNGRSWWAFWRG